MHLVQSWQSSWVPRTRNQWLYQCLVIYKVFKVPHLSQKGGFSFAYQVQSAMLGYFLLWKRSWANLGNFNLPLPQPFIALGQVPRTVVWSCLFLCWWMSAVYNPRTKAALLPWLLAYLVVLMSLTGKHIWSISHILICEGDQPLVLLNWKQTGDRKLCIDFYLGWHSQDEMGSSLGTFQPLPFDHLTQMCGIIEEIGEFLSTSTNLFLLYYIVFLSFLSCCNYIVMDFMVEKIESPIASQLQLS